MSSTSFDVQYAIYVSAKTQNNFDYTLKSASEQGTDAVWGSKEGVLDKYLDHRLIDKYVVFVVKLSNKNLSGFPRVDEDKLDEFCQSSASRIVIAKITSNIRKETQPFWPDEQPDVKYPFRFTFQVVSDQQDVINIGDCIGKLACNAIRLGASNGSMQQIIREDRPTQPRKVITMNHPNRLNECIRTLQELLKTANYVVADDLLVYRFISALIAKRFLILSGLSGSGKTKIAQLFAYWLNGRNTDAVSIIPVGADWVSNEQLLGYPDGLQPGVYVGKPVLKTILSALKKENEHIPHIVILDEMNLSHVERYFSDFLSALESDEEIPLYDGADRSFGEQSVPQRLKLPKNLFIIGTINVDETTYMFSPKVLDRANVIEFRMDRNMMNTYFTNPQNINESKVYGKGQMFQSEFVDWSTATDQYFAMSDDWQVLYKHHMGLAFDEMSKARVEFGYRVLNETRRFLSVMQHIHTNTPNRSSANTFVNAFDCVVVQKLMPKLNGSGSAMKMLLEYFANLKVDGQPLTLTNAKATRMLEKLKQDMYVSFAEA